LALLAGVASASRSAEENVAKRALLVLADMPKGWTQSRSTGNGGGTFPGASNLAGCIGVSARAITLNPPSANSNEFDSANESLSVDDSVSAFPSRSIANEQYSAISNPKTPACMTTLLNGPLKSLLLSSAGSGAEVGSISVTKEPSSRFARHATALTVAFSLTERGETVRVQTTEVFFVRGKEGQQITFTAIATSFPRTLAHRLTGLAMTRL
jgi:hypothetical protein